MAPQSLLAQPLEPSPSADLHLYLMSKSLVPAPCCPGRAWHRVHAQVALGKGGRGDGGMCEQVFADISPMVAIESYLSVGISYSLLALLEGLFL